jgi:hypothetical protein
MALGTRTTTLADGTMIVDYDDVIQLKLKTPEDLRHHLRIHGQARHIVHDSDSDWWWFCDHRNKLLEYVFNSDSPVTFCKFPDETGRETVWEPECNLIPNMKFFELRPTFIYATITEEMLVDLFWNDFLSQDLGPYAYWDIDNPDNRLEEFIHYWEMEASGLHMESAASEEAETKSG